MMVPFVLLALADHVIGGDIAESRPIAQDDGPMLTADEGRIAHVFVIYLTVPAPNPCSPPNNFGRRSSSA